jgi:hypothetical protein
MRTVAVVNVLGLVGFATASWIAEPGALALTGGGGGGYESEQGPKLFATADAALEGVEIPYVPTRPAGYARLRIDSGRLVQILADGSARGDFTELALGARWPGKTVHPPVTLQITAAREHANIYTGERYGVWEYEVQVVDGAAKHPLCDDVHNRALAVPGAWQGGALSSVDSDQWFTFSCVPVRVADSPVAVQKTLFQIRKPIAISVDERRRLGLPIIEVAGPRWPGGAAAKCIDYGYAPWPGGSAPLGKITRTAHKVPSSVEAARRFHNLCTRAMTADYESNGSSHTIPGTVIRIFDLTNLPIELCTGVMLPTNCKLISPDTATSAPPIFHQAKTVEASISQFHTAELVAPSFAALYYESVWSIDDSGVARASCLAKLRWKTIDAQHVGQVTYSPAKAKPGDDWQYCDDRTVYSFHDNDTTPQLIVYSAINETGLYRFQLATDPPRWLTTSHVQSTKRGIEPGPGIACAQPCVPVFQGDLLSPDEPSETRKGWTTVPVFLYRNAAGDYATVGRDGAEPKPVLPPGYHLFELAPPALAAPPSTASPSTAKPGVSAKPSLGPTATASAGTRPPFTAAAEGYLFKDPPVMPDSSRFGVTPARAAPLYVWKHDGAYCTGHRACSSATGGRTALGYVLLPAKTAIELSQDSTPSITNRPSIEPRKGR